MSKADTYLPYSNEERQIYRFNDGKSNRAVDPLKYLRKLHGVENLSLENDLKLAALEGEMFATEADAATNRLIDSAREVFGLAEYSEDGDRPTGLTDLEAFGVLVNFVQFVGGLAKSAVPFPNSPANTDQPDSDESVTASSSACPSTANALDASEQQISG